MDFWTPTERTRAAKNPHQWFTEGKALFGSGQYPEAARAFQRAFLIAPEKPLFMSYFGLCKTMTPKGAGDGLRLCRDAVKKSPYDAEILHNLGVAYLMAGKKRQAHAAFAQGASLDPRFAENKEELTFMGVRKPPVFSSLPRDHWANVLAGKALSRLKLR